MKTPDWHSEAACRDLDPTVFYADHDLGITESIAHANKAKAICATCPVVDECLEHALTRFEAGVWGGTTEKERRKMRRERGLDWRGKPIVHGTVTGYKRGCREACCREAHATAKRLRAS